MLGSSGSFVLLMSDDDDIFLPSAVTMHDLTCTVLTLVLVTHTLPTDDIHSPFPTESLQSNIHPLRVSKTMKNI